MNNVLLIGMFFGILVNMILLLNVCNELLNLKADLYYYSELKGDSNGRE